MSPKALFLHTTQRGPAAAGDVPNAIAGDLGEVTELMKCPHQNRCDSYKKLMERSMIIIS